MNLRMDLLLVTMLLGTTLSAAAQATAANPLNDLLTMQMNWDVSKSNDNAKSSGTMKFVPYEHHKQDGKSFTSYYLFASGLPSDKTYTLIRWQIGWDAQQPPINPVQSDLYVNARGVVMCRKPNEKEMNYDAASIDEDARLNVISAGSMGEPVRFALLEGKSSIVAMGRLIVNPIQADEHGCHLQAILALGGGEIVLVEGTGFAAKSSVEISSTSGGKPQTAKFKTDPDGRLETAVVLVKEGQTHGMATITMKSDSCAPSVTFNWGAGSYQVK